MTAKLLTQAQFEEAIDTFLGAHLGLVHREDVGPLFGQVAALRREWHFDSGARRQWAEAVSAALAPFPRETVGTHASMPDGAGERRARMSALAPGVHAALHASVDSTRRGGR